MATQAIQRRMAAMLIPSFCPSYIVERPAGLRQADRPWMARTRYDGRAACTCSCRATADHVLQPSSIVNFKVLEPRQGQSFVVSRMNSVELSLKVAPIDAELHDRYD